MLETVRQRVTCARPVLGTQVLPTVGGIIASYAFLAKDAPKYVRGYSVCVAFECLAVVMCVLYRLGIALDVRKQKEAQRKAAAEGRALNPDSEFVYVT